MTATFPDGATRGGGDRDDIGRALSSARSAASACSARVGSCAATSSGPLKPGPKPAASRSNACRVLVPGGSLPASLESSRSAKTGISRTSMTSDRTDRQRPRPRLHDQAPRAPARALGRREASGRGSPPPFSAARAGPSPLGARRAAATVAPDDAGDRSARAARAGRSATRPASAARRAPRRSRART